MTSTAVARQQPGQVFALPAKQSTLFEQARAQIEPYLPRGVDFQSVIADVFLATRKNPDLLNQDAESLVMAVVEVQQRGLRIGSTCHLVPKGGKVHAWNDIRGDVEMIIRSGACRDITANPVYEHEPFSLTETASGPDMRHEVIADAESRGAMKGAYARFWLGGTRYMVKYLALADIETVRKGSLSWGPSRVKTCPPWYALKTVIRQGAKYLPKNRNLLSVYTAFDRDAELDAPAMPELPGLREPADMSTVVGGEMVDMSTGEIREPAALGPEHGSLSWARAFKLPWRNSDLFGTPIGTFSKDHLQSIAEWCDKRITAANEQGKEVPTSTVDLYDATQLILEHIALEQANADAQPEAVEEDTDLPALSEQPAEQIEAAIAEPERPAPGSLRHDVPKPGKIADALELNDKRAQPNRNAQMD